MTTYSQVPPAVAEEQVGPDANAKVGGTRRRIARRGGAPLFDSSERTLISGFERRKRSVRFTLFAINALLLIVLLVAGLGPIIWLAKSAITPTQDTLRTPMEFFPGGTAWDNLWKAWVDVKISTQFLNTIWVAVGSWLVQMLVATTGGFALAILKPAYAKVVNALIIGTLLVPSVVLLVPLYLTILNPPLIGHSLINTFWAVWLPAGASAFNVVLMSRFMGGLPSEIFEAARVDGAGPFRLFWSLALPMSKPILGVVSIFAVLAAWKDYLWPLLVLRDPAIQPLSVRLPTLQQAIELDVYLAALAISTLIPIAIFLIFQRLILRGAGLGGAIKG